MCIRDRPTLWPPFGFPSLSSCNPLFLIIPIKERILFSNLYHLFPNHPNHPNPNLSESCHHLIIPSSDHHYLQYLQSQTLLILKGGFALYQLFPPPITQFQCRPLYADLDRSIRAEWTIGSIKRWSNARAPKNSGSAKSITGFAQNRLQSGSAKGRLELNGTNINYG